MFPSSRNKFAGFVSATVGRKYSPSPAAESNSQGGLSPAGFSVYQVYNLSYYLEEKVVYLVEQKT